MRKKTSNAPRTSSDSFVSKAISIKVLRSRAHTCEYPLPASNPSANNFRPMASAFWREESERICCARATGGGAVSFFDVHMQAKAASPIKHIAFIDFELVILLDKVVIFKLAVSICLGIFVLRYYLSGRLRKQKGFVFPSRVYEQALINE